MLKNHPPGLIVAFFANMGERFGFYTMMAILVFFLQSKYGLSEDDAGWIYSVFYFAIYGLALVGGLIADRTRNYKGTIFVGLLTMLCGYVLMTVPWLGLYVTVAALGVVAFGNGLFKGNLQAVVGQMYDDPKYSSLRDSAYSVFYMGINIGAFFAPSAATGVRNWFLAREGFGFDASLPSLCHQQMAGTLENTDELRRLAATVSSGPVDDLTSFAREYVAAFSTGYHYAFGVAACAMVVSSIIFIIFQRILPSVKKKEKGAAAETPQLSKDEERRRLVALGLVFAVVIFFWMSFHQNGLTLNYFARDYTVKHVDAFTNVFFDIRSFLAVIVAIFGVVVLVRPKSSMLARGIGVALLVAGGSIAYWLYSGFSGSNQIEPEKFQQFNPIFIVALTPLVVAAFAWLRSKGKEPSSPKKIGFGMILAALGFVLMMVASFGLVSQAGLEGQPSPDRVSPYWLINTYFILTVAELFLSPMGISFVSKVAPPRLQGLMQGCWLGATALGNQLLFVGSLMYVRFQVWQVWLVFVICCLLAAAFIFGVMKKLEKATSDA